MMANLFLGRDAFVDFSISVTGIVLVIPALLWMFFGKPISAKHSGKNSFDPTALSLSWIALIMIVILVAPVSSSMTKKLIGSALLSEAFIVIPTALIVVYSFIQLTHSQHIKGRSYVGATICLSLLIIVSSSIPIRAGYRPNIKPISNMMKIDPEVYQICDIVGHNRVLLPKEILGQVGEFDSKIQPVPMAYLTHDETDPLKVANAAITQDNAMVVINKAYTDITFEWLQYEKIAETDHYVIYQRFIE